MSEVHTVYMYICMSEMNTACTCACQRCTPYVHVHVRGAHRMYICMSEVHTVRICMHVRGAHLMYICMSEVHTVRTGIHSKGAGLLGTRLVSEGLSAQTQNERSIQHAHFTH